MCVWICVCVYIIFGDEDKLTVDDKIAKCIVKVTVCVYGYVHVCLYLLYIIFGIYEDR